MNRFTAFLLMIAFAGLIGILAAGRGESQHVDAVVKVDAPPPLTNEEFKAGIADGTIKLLDVKDFPGLQAPPYVQAPPSRAWLELDTPPVPLPPVEQGNHPADEGDQSSWGDMTSNYVDDWATSESFEPSYRVGIGNDQRHWNASQADHGEFMPDVDKTTGAFWKQVTVKQVRKPNYSKTVRKVPESLKKQVFARYGIPYEDRDKYEVDHLVPLSWGGSNAIDNLWPQPYAGEWNAHVKDRLEVHALAMIRSGDLELRDAQKAIANDWIAFYQRLIGKHAYSMAIEDDEQ